MAYLKRPKPLLGSASFGDDIAAGFDGQLRAGILYDNASPGEKTYVQEDGTTDYTKPRMEHEVAQFAFQGIAVVQDNRFDELSSVFEMESNLNARPEIKITMVLCDAVPEVGDRITMDNHDVSITSIMKGAPDDSFFVVLCS